MAQFRNYLLLAEKLVMYSPMGDFHFPPHFVPCTTSI